MTKQQMKQIEALVKSFNEKCEKRGGEKNYRCEIGHYKRNGYAVAIYFSKIFYSVDFEELAKNVYSLGLCMYIGSRMYVHII